jgi:hypothetical protein
MLPISLLVQAALGECLVAFLLGNGDLERCPNLLPGQHESSFKQALLVGEFAPKTSTIPQALHSGQHCHRFTLERSLPFWLFKTPLLRCSCLLLEKSFRCNHYLAIVLHVMNLSEDSALSLSLAVSLFPSPTHSHALVCAAKSAQSNLKRCTCYMCEWHLFRMKGWLHNINLWQRRFATRRPQSIWFLAAWTTRQVRQNLIS